MNNIPTYINTEIAPNGTWCCLLGVSRSYLCAGYRNHIPDFPDHEKTGAAHDKTFQGREEWFCQVFLVLLGYPPFS
jgi:hypothetical protein